jgi:hypothetical protein
VKRAIFIVCLISGCALQGKREQEFASLQKGAKSICEVMADPNAYAGRRIVIKGTYFQEPHRRVIYDENCPDFDLSINHSSQLEGNPAAERRLRRSFKARLTGVIPVVYSAVLTPKALVLGCGEPSCFEYSLQEAQLLTASTP